MTRGEARSFLREHKGQTMCVSYARDAEGRIRFRPEPEVVAEPVLVPVSRLRARPSRRAGLVAALGVSAALAACAPHGEPPREVSIPAKVAKPETTKVEVEGPKPDAVPMAGAAVIPEEPMVEGEIEVPDPEQMVDGEMRVPDPEAIDEPCDGTSKAKVEAEALHARR
ncbi:hypothetical protein [Paraliomyxa miuraensis]|uniref:hypothetical protein n=1 Tax=Paraliomyxa miuraensis TaxID=376150 RepID=UPI00225884F0|nr:hypothetical protein [Paraliomyxa miuraensis]MCX4240758.1 hypothetical protein [Paraliomyxa miuraensis]